MRRMVLMLLALCSIGGVASAADTTIGGVTLTLPLPAGYCELDPSQPGDARMLSVVGAALGGGNRLLSMSADCRQLGDWRIGRRPLLANYMQYQTLRAWENIALPAPPAELLRTTCSQLRAQGQVLAQQTVPEAQQRLDQAMANIRFNEQRFMGILHEDAAACYGSLLAKFRAETGANIEQTTIFGVTVAKAKIVYVYGFAPYARGSSVKGLLERVKSSVAALQAANR